MSLPARVEPPVAQGRQYLTFLLGEEIYALGIHGIKEIIECSSPTALPMMPDFVRGVINLRGRVVPVIDLTARFWGRPSSIGRRSCIVIVEGERQDVGVIVDAVSAVIDIPPDDIEPAPAFGAGIRADFIQGMGKVEGRFVIVLDADCVLATDPIIRLAQTPVQ